jgi:hypothetical protein
VILLLYFGSFVKITGDNSQLIEILLCGWNNSARIFGQCAARKGYGILIYWQIVYSYLMGVDAIDQTICPEVLGMTKCSIA